MREVITRSQASDMGSGCGYVVGADNYILKEVLDFYAKNSCEWGVVCIYRNGNIVHKMEVC